MALTRFTESDLAVVERYIPGGGRLCTTCADAGLGVVCKDIPTGRRVAFDPLEPRRQFAMATPTESCLSRSSLCSGSGEISKGDSDRALTIKMRWSLQPEARELVR